MKEKEISENEFKIPDFPPLLDIELSIGIDGKPLWGRAKSWSAILPVLGNSKIKQRLYRTYKTRSFIVSKTIINKYLVYRIIDFSRFKELENKRFPKGSFEIFKEINNLILGNEYKIKIIGGTCFSPIIAADWMQIRIIKDIISVSIKYMSTCRYSNNPLMISELKERIKKIIPQANQLIESISDFEDEWFDIIFDSSTIEYNLLGSPALDYMSWKVESFDSWMKGDSSDLKYVYKNSLAALSSRFEKAEKLLLLVNIDANGTIFNKLLGDPETMLLSKTLLFIEKYNKSNKSKKPYKVIRLAELIKCFVNNSSPEAITTKIEYKDYIATKIESYKHVRSWRKLIETRLDAWKSIVRKCLKNPGNESLVAEAGEATRNLEFLFRGPGPAKKARKI